MYLEIANMTLKQEATSKQKQQFGQENIHQHKMYVEKPGLIIRDFGRDCSQFCYYNTTGVQTFH